MEICLFKALQIIDEDAEVAACNLTCQINMLCFVVSSVIIKSTTADLMEWYVCNIAECDYVLSAG